MSLCQTAHEWQISELRVSLDGQVMTLTPKIWAFCKMTLQFRALCGRQAVMNPDLSCTVKDLYLDLSTHFGIPIPDLVLILHGSRLPDELPISAIDTTSGESITVFNRTQTAESVALPMDECSCPHFSPGSNIRPWMHDLVRDSNVDAIRVVMQGNGHITRVEAEDILAIASGDERLARGMAVERDGRSDPELVAFRQRHRGTCIDYITRKDTWNLYQIAKLNQIREEPVIGMFMRMGFSVPAVMRMINGH
jgi:hypothetical protein